MSVLNGILQNALSGLNTNQAALRATSTNITNVNTPGYTRRLVEQQSLVNGGMSAGVRLADPRRAVDEFVTRELRVRTAQSELYSAQEEYQDRVQSLIGRPQDAFSMSGRLNQLLSDLSTAATSPESSVQRSTVLDSFTAWGEEIGRVAQQLQNLRADADERIAGLTGNINALLATIKNINPQVVVVKATGGDATALEEQRDQAVQQLAKLVDVQVAEQSDGSYHILTQSGAVLLDSALRQLTYGSQGAASAGLAYPQISIDRVDPATGQNIPTGGFLDSLLRGGQLKGLIDARNVQLPKIAAQLGELAGAVVDRFNQVHNANTAAAGPDGLTGRDVGALSTDTNNFTGIATFAVLDASNNVVSSASVNLATAGATLGAVIATVNTALGGSGTLSLTNGAMSFSATSGVNRVVIAQDATTPSSLGGHGFSDYFGMNDIMTARVPAHYDTGLTGADAHGFPAGSVTMRLRGPGGDAVGSFTLNLGTAPATIGGVVSALNTGMSGFASFGLDPNGALTSTISNNYTGYTLEVASDTTERGGAGTTGLTFSRYFGVGEPFRQGAAFDIRVRDDILDNPDLLSLARLSVADSPAITIGDNRGGLALAAIDQTQVRFATAGDIPTTLASLTGYTGQVLGATAAAANAVSDLAKSANAVREAVQTRRDEASAVNLDEELAAMITYQNAYNASAKLITTANELYETLLSLVR